MATLAAAATAVEVGSKFWPIILYGVGAVGFFGGYAVGRKLSGFKMSMWDLMNSHLRQEDYDKLFNNWEHSGFDKREVRGVNWKNISRHSDLEQAFENWLAKDNRQGDLEKRQSETRGLRIQFLKSS